MKALLSASLAGALLVGCSSTPPQLAGPAAPDFSGTTRAGDDVSLAAMQGNVVILDFWAVW